MKFATVFLCLVVGALASQVRFDGFQVHRVFPKTEAQIEALRNLENIHTGFSFWTSVSKVNRSVDIMVPPHLHYDFKDFVALQHLDDSIYIENVQEKIDLEKKGVREPRFGWTAYYRLAEIDAWLSGLVAQYPDKVTGILAGKSYEGREIRGVRISFSTANENNAIFIEGGIHAREWISPAVVTYIANEILTSTDPAVRSTVEKYDWYIVPVFNPDGYEYTHTNNRLWRKTRVPYGLLCRGADPNRNWGYQWNNGGASTNPCSETYAGPSAFSEPSTKSTSEYISTIQSKLIAYLAFHSYSQLILIPYGHSPAHVENYDDLYVVGLKAAISLGRRYGTRYTVGNIVEVIYVASGGSMDWVKGTYSTPITYTYELRDTGRNGFILPPEQIIPSGEETFDSVITILDEFEKLK